MVVKQLLLVSLHDGLIFRFKLKSVNATSLHDHFRGGEALDFIFCRLGLLFLLDGHLLVSLLS